MPPSCGDELLALWPMGYWLSLFQHSNSVVLFAFFKKNQALIIPNLSLKMACPLRTPNYLQDTEAWERISGVPPPDNSIMMRPCLLLPTSQQGALKEIFAPGGKVGCAYLVMVT